MQKFLLLLFFSSFLVNTFFVSQAETPPDSYLETKKVTRIRLFLQVDYNRTSWIVARANISNNVSLFGTVVVEDHPITYGPEIKSGELGRMQGIVVFSDLRRPSLTLVDTVVFTHGEYKGSTFNVVGRIPLTEKVREVPIVGGTGDFRIASGYAITRTLSYGELLTGGVAEYHAVIYHG